MEYYSDMIPDYRVVHMLTIQLTALGLAAAIAYLINRPERAVWRMVVGPVTGLLVGSFVAASLGFGISGEATDAEHTIRAMGYSFWLALAGALVGTVYGRSNASRPADVKEYRESSQKARVKPLSPATTSHNFVCDEPPRSVRDWLNVLLGLTFVMAVGIAIALLFQHLR